MQNEIDIQTFCGLQGVSSSDEFVLCKMHKGTKKTYDAWYKVVSPNFNISEKKVFWTTEKPKESNDIKNNNKK
jgi:hypothetical protein